MLNALISLLLVADNKLDIELFERTLQGTARGFALTVARDGSEAYGAAAGVSATATLAEK